MRYGPLSAMPSHAIACQSRGRAVHDHPNSALPSGWVVTAVRQHDQKSLDPKRKLVS